MKPIALKAKEGFGALIGRSKSAPPMPAEQVGKRPPSKSSVPPKMEDNNESNMPPINEKIDLPYLDLPNPHPTNTNRLTISSTDPQPPFSQPQTPKLDSATPHTSHLTPVTPPRITSPSLEAYFIDRKRRSVSVGAATPRIVTPTPGVKGKGFKSSPLSPTEKDTTDGAMSKGTNDVIREGDESAPASEPVVGDNKSNEL